MGLAIYTKTCLFWKWLPDTVNGCLGSHCSGTEIEEGGSHIVWKEGWLQVHRHSCGSMGSAPGLRTAEDILCDSWGWAVRVSSLERWAITGHACLPWGAMLYKSPSCMEREVQVSQVIVPASPSLTVNPRSHDGSKAAPSESHLPSHVSLAEALTARGQTSTGTDVPCYAPAHRMTCRIKWLLHTPQVWGDFLTLKRVTGQQHRNTLAFTAFNGTQPFPSGNRPAYLGLNANQVHYFGIDPVPAG